MGRTIAVRFNSLAGDQPLLVVDQTHLSGDNLQVTVYEVTIQICMYTSNPNRTHTKYHFVI